ncbi:MAG: hypothetical protein ACFFD4_00800 [Candidatus Odinarchaeota archaeon]
MKITLRVSFKVISLITVFLLVFTFQAGSGSTNLETLGIQDSDFFNNEYSSGVIAGEYIDLAYAWAQTNETSLISLAMFNDNDKMAPVQPFFGQRIEIEGSEFFAGNILAGFEVYEDKNGNNILDTREELVYYVMVNASQHFTATSVEQTIINDNERSYTWKFSYGEVDGFLSPFESSPPDYTYQKTIIDSVNMSFTFDITNETSLLKLSIEMGDWNAYEFYLDQNYQEIKVDDVDISGYGLSILFGTTISSEEEVDFVTKNDTSGLAETSLQVNGTRIFDLNFGDSYDLGITGSALPSYTTVADPASLYEEQVMSWGGPPVLLNWLSASFPLISGLPSIPPLGLEEISFLYRICYPEWGGSPFHHDPRYRAYFSSDVVIPTGTTETSKTTSKSTDLPKTPGFLVISVLGIPLLAGRKLFQSKKR